MTDLDPDRWQRVKALFHRVAELPPDRREAELAASDIEIADEVRSLVAADVREGEVLEQAIAAGVGLSQAAGFTGQRVGRYRLCGRLGEGGMGEVFLAERDDGVFEKRVAVKVVRTGLLSSASVARFAEERRVLARLDHPGIARLLDGGSTEDGAPYLVMELVEGEPIDLWCDARGLGVEPRLELFRSVCAAVQYAHANLVVHRDVKPSNILVTPNGSVKLLDFGIATLLEDADQDGGRTRTLERFLTPEYASPEQVAGGAITVAADVWGLGVLLYRLLTGRLPFEVRGLSPGEAENLVRFTEPVRPSLAVRPDGGRDGRGLARRLRGDLDLIVQRALHKQPERRYASVEQLSEDIRRHLEGLPVKARPDAVGYRVSRFVRRHVLATVSAVVVSVALAVSTGVSAWQATAARRERARAEASLRELRGLVNSFLFEFNDALTPLAGSTEARGLVVKKALEVLDGLAADAAGDREAELQLAEAYERWGTVQGNPFGPNLGDTVGALRSYRKALAIRQRLAAGASDAAAEAALAAGWDRVGEVLQWAGDLDGALGDFRRGLAIREARAARHPDDPAARRDVAVSHFKIAAVARMLGRWDEAVASSETTVSVFEGLHAEAPQDRKLERSLMVCRGTFGDLLVETGHERAALPHLEKSLAEARSIAERTPQDVGAMRDVTIALTRLARARSRTGDLEGGLASQQEALRLTGALASADPKNATLQRDLAVCEYRLGNQLRDAHRLPEARASYERSARHSEALSAADPGNAGLLHDIANCWARLADAWVAESRWAEAEPAFERALTAHERAATAAPSDDLERRDRAEAMATAGAVAEALARGTSGEHARRWWRTGIERYRASSAIWKAVEDDGRIQPEDAGARERAEEGRARCAASLGEARQSPP